MDSPWVRANFDPVNLLGNFSAVWHNAEAMRHMWQTLGRCYTNSAHIKDVVTDADFVDAETKKFAGIIQKEGLQMDVQ